MATFSLDVNSAMINMVWMPRLVGVHFRGMRRMSTWYGCHVWPVHFLGCDAGLIMHNATFHVWWEFKLKQTW
jgi:hypothetical protein